MNPYISAPKNLLYFSLFLLPLFQVFSVVTIMPDFSFPNNGSFHEQCNTF